VGVSILENIRNNLSICNVDASEIQSTAGNYNDSGNLIPGSIPSFTTNLCEIGSIKDSIFFTYILFSSFASVENLRALVVKYPLAQIYGFKDFLKNYYPTEISGVDINYSNLLQLVQRERLFQIQLTISKNHDAEHLTHLYFDIEELLKNNGLHCVNQRDTKLIELVKKAN
jgi:hypothetical protein